MSVAKGRTIRKLMGVEGGGGAKYIFGQGKIK